MVDFLDDLDARRRRDGVPAQLTPLVVIVRSVELLRTARVRAFGDLYRGDLEVVLVLPGRVGPEEEPMRRVRLVRGSAGALNGREG
jgi:hypothetical protein